MKKSINFHAANLPSVQIKIQYTRFSTFVSSIDFCIYTLFFWLKPGAGSVTLTSPRINNIYFTSNSEVCARKQLSWKTSTVSWQECVCLVLLVTPWQFTGSGSWPRLDRQQCSAFFQHQGGTVLRINCCRVKKHLTFIAEEVKLHSQKTHSFTEGVRGRAFLLGTQLQDLQWRHITHNMAELTYIWQ